MVARPQPERTALPAQTLARFVRGDREAFLMVYEALAGEVRPLVSRFFASPFEREEALQEVWLQVHRSAHLYDPGRGGIGGWVRAVALNRCKELLRARGRRVQPGQALDEGDLRAEDDPEQAARDRRLREAVTRFEATLAADEAVVLRLSLVEERPLEEVARAAGISVRRCKYLRHRLLVRAAADPALRAALAEVTS